jgi:hypothetical protein
MLGLFPFAAVEWWQVQRPIAPYHHSTMPSIAGIIRARRDTWLKKDTHQAADLGDHEKHLLRAGDELRLRAVGRDPVDSHFLITIDRNLDTEDGSEAYNTWFVFASAEHWEVLEDNRRAPSESVMPTPPPIPSGRVIALPGRGLVQLNALIQSGSPGFTWAEATKDGSRIPATPEVVAGIERMAIALAPVREKFGPLRVTSWYRPESVNKAVGGAKNSWHIQGSAVDLYPANGSVWDLQTWAVENWDGGVGTGAHRGFVHLDLRGFRSRFSY